MNQSYFRMMKKRGISFILTVCSFRINLYDRSYFSGPTNKRSYKQGWQSNGTIQTGNRYETFSVTFTCFILSVCCTESYGSRWDKTLNMRHQAQKGFCGIFAGIPQHQKGYLLYLPSTRKVIFSYNVVFDESFSSAFSYMSRLYAEAMVMRPTVPYTP